MDTPIRGQHEALTDRAYEWAPLAGEYTFERLSVEPSVPRRPSATRTSDTLTLRITHDDGSDGFIILHTHEINWLASVLPDTARNMRLERLILQCQDMGYMPVRNDTLNILVESAAPSGMSSEDADAIFAAPHSVEIAGTLCNLAGRHE